MRALKEELVVSPSDLKVPLDQYMPLLELGMSKLTERERQAIFLRFWEPFTIAQVADQMRLSWDEANKLIDEAVEKMRRIFRERLNSKNNELRAIQTKQTSKL